MNVLITLTSAGTDTGPFNLYSNVDNYTTAFETNISKGILVAGYTSTIVPPGTSAIRVKSMGICTNYVDITLTVPSTTTTTTTGIPVSTTTTTTTTAAPSPSTSTTTTTTTAYVGPSTSTTTTTSSTTTTAYVGPSTSTTTTTSSTSTSTTTTTAYVGPSTTTTTTTASNLQWYQITRCDTLAVEYSAGYAPGTFLLNDRVTDFGSNVYTVTNTYSTDPGGSGLFLAPTGFTGCPGDITTTTTTTGAPIVGTTTTTTSTTSTTTTSAPTPSSILVDVVETAGPDQDCLGTLYNTMVQTATATVYDQYGNVINAASNITVTLNTTYNPCYGGSSTTPVTITILGGTSGNSTNWTSSTTVDCGGAGCLSETQYYNCTLSNDAGLSWKAPTITC